MSKKSDVDTWATIAAEVSVAAVNIKKCPICGEPTMKVPNAILCSATGNLVKHIKGSRRAGISQHATGNVIKEVEKK